MPRTLRGRWGMSKLRRPLCIRPHLECLEDRTLLTTVMNYMPVAPSSPPGGPGLQGTLPPPPDLSYNGGPLLQNVQVTGVYYNDPTGTGSLQSALDGWFNTILPSDYLTQFLNKFSAGGQTIGAGTFEGDVNNGLTLPEGGVVTDTQIQAMLSTELSLGQIAPNANSLYFVFVPQGVEVDAGFGNSVYNFLGYHSSFFDLASGQTINYAVIPWEGAALDGTTGPDGSNAELGSEIQYFHGQLTTDPLTELQDLTGVGAHELAEAITDPSVGATGNFGWLDTSSDAGQGQEIGDLANAELMTYKGYVMQELWSRNANDRVGQATGPVGAPADADFYLSQINNPTEGNFNGVLATLTDTNHSNQPVSDFNVAVVWDDGSSNSTGDGSGALTVVNNGNGTYSIIGKHTYDYPAGTDLGSYPFNFDGIKVFVQDTTTGQVAWNKPAVELQDAPLTNFASNSFTASVKKPVSSQLLTTFTDAGSYQSGGNPSDYTAHINWGDNTGNDSNVTIQAHGFDANGNQIYQVFGNSHTYTKSGTDKVVVTITDGANTDTVTDTATVNGSGGGGGGGGGHSTITGRVFNDLNHTGVEKRSDPGLAGVTVFLDANGNGILDPGEISTTTDAKGQYKFTGLAAGKYHVGEVVPLGYVESHPNPAGDLKVTLLNRRTTSNVDFGDYVATSGSSGADSSS